MSKTRGNLNIWGLEDEALKVKTSESKLTELRLIMIVQATEIGQLWSGISVRPL